MNACYFNASRRGFIGIIVAVGIFALAGAAAIFSVAVNSSRNRRTIETLTNPDATEAELASISDQDIQNARNDFGTNASLLTGYASLGTATLPSGDTAAEVGGRALTEQIQNYATPAAVDYMSDPSSSWNRNDGADRPSEGTEPTGGVVPPDPDEPTSQAVCGDGTCDSPAGEQTTCPEDCPRECGDGRCNAAAGEISSCPEDCPEVQCCVETGGCPSEELYSCPGSCCCCPSGAVCVQVEARWTCGF